MRLRLNSIRQQTPAEEGEEGLSRECLPLRGARSQLTGRLSDRLGPSVEETVTESRTKLSLKHSCLFFLYGGSYRGSLAARQTGSGAKIMMK